MPIPSASQVHNQPFVTPANLQGTPEPLRRPSGNRIDFPVASMGKVLENAALALHDVFQSPIELCAQSLLASVSLAVQPHADIALGPRSMPISLFMFTLAESGERKSAVDTECLRPHRKWEYNARLEWETKIKRWKRDFNIWDSEYRAIASNRKLDKGRKDYELEQLGPEPEKEREPLLLIDEPTFEGLVRLYERALPNVGLFSSEGGQFLGGYSMSKDHLQKSITGLSRLWDGQSVTRIRASEDHSVVLEKRRFSMHLMIQPKLAYPLFGNALAQEQGFLSRILVTAPPSAAHNFRYKHPDKDYEYAMEAYRDRILDILETPLDYQDKIRGELRPRLLTVDPLAEARWIDFHDGVHQRLNKDGAYRSVKAFASKAPEHALRIAANLTLFDDVTSTCVSEEWMAYGINLANYYIQEHIRLYQDMQYDQGVVDAEELLAWLRKHKIQYVYPSMVYTRGPRNFRDRDEALMGLRRLEEFGYLLTLPKGTEIEGKFRREGWQVLDEEPMPAP